MHLASLCGVDGIANLYLDRQWMAFKVTGVEWRQLSGESHTDTWSASKPFPRAGLL